jgi:capsular polysaccharide biosynthesis protein
LSGPFYGTDYPLTLRPNRAARLRPAVDVVEVRDGEALIYNDNVVVCSNDGQPFADLSVSQLSGVIAHHVRSKAADAETREVDTAVVVIDSFPAPNICHFLLDQMSRLELYGRVGATAAASTVIGPPATAFYQQAILKQLGVTDYISAKGPCIVRAKRLLVSRTCWKTHMHPAHGGAPWALNFIRKAFGVEDGERRNRIYISRADAMGRNIANEAELAARLRQAGFEEVVASELSVADQVELFRNASHVVGMHGAGFTNIVFCPPGAHILEFFHPLYGSWAYGLIAAPLGLDYRPFIGHDALSADPIYNDPDQPDFSALGFAGRGAANNRDIRVDLAILDKWLAEVG